MAEPTQLQVVVAHKGVVRWTCRTQGRAAHSSQPQLGENAIYKMARVVQAIEQYHLHVLGGRPSHPLCGPPTVCVSTITGGVCINTVPDRASIEIDRRLAPDESPDEACSDLIRYLSARDLGARRGSFTSRRGSSHGGLSDRNNGPLAAEVVRIAAQVVPECSTIGVPYGTDASVISAAGVPTVVFGPGSIEQAHTADEWISVDQLERAAEIYSRLPLEFQL